MAERRYSEQVQQMWNDAKRDGVVTQAEAAAIKTQMALEDEARNRPPEPPGALEQALPVIGIAGGAAAAQQLGQAAINGLLTPSSGAAPGIPSVVGASTQAAPSLGAAPGVPQVVNAGQTGASGASAAGSMFGPSTGAIGLNSLGVLGPAAAVTAYYGPSAAHYGGEVLGAIKDGDLSQVDSDEGVKSLMLTNPITAWAVPIMDALGVGIKSGKDKDQRVRDNIRGHLQDIGFIDENYNANIGDGRFYNFGSEELRSGVTDPSQVGEEIEGTPLNQSYNIDWKSYEANPQNQSVLGGMNALMAALTGAQTDRWQDFSSNAYNAAIHGGNDAEATVDQFYQNAEDIGFGWGQQKEAIRQAWASGNLDANERDAAFAEIDKRYGVVNESGARWDEQVLMDEEQRRRNEEELAAGYTAVGPAAGITTRG